MFRIADPAEVEKVKEAVAPAKSGFFGKVFRFFIWAIVIVIILFVAYQFL